MDVLVVPRAIYVEMSAHVAAEGAACPRANSRSCTRPHETISVQDCTSQIALLRICIRRLKQAVVAAVAEGQPWPSQWLLAESFELTRRVRRSRAAHRSHVVPDNEQH